ncbi:hypothetical protein C8R44DRAFT_958945 [Mycena epipterygia]|nr:hypothetical protein C8R44DRAFT_958945 [Mycena epipterygia]
MPPKRKTTRKTSISPEEKAERRRNASRRYYLKHPEVREKNRLHAEKKKAAAKARRRRWDAPKEVRRDVTTPPTEDDNVELDNDGTPLASATTSFEKLRTTAENVAAQALAEMAQAEMAQADDSILSPGNQCSSLSDSFESILVRVNQLSGLSATSTLSVDIAPLKLSAINQLDQARPTEARGSRESTWVKTLQAKIAELNSGVLLRPTASEVYAWEASGTDLTPLRKMISVQHGAELATWAREVGRTQDNSWDMVAYREFSDIATRLTAETHQHVGILGVASDVLRCKRLGN